MLIHFQELYRTVTKEVKQDLEVLIFGQILSVKKMELKEFYPLIKIYTKIGQRFYSLTVMELYIKVVT